MMNVFKKQLALILALTLIVAATFCGCQSKENKIVGRWNKIDGGQFTYLEFFSDGTYTSSHVNYSGNYSIDGDRIKLTGILVEAKVYTLEFEGNTMKLLYDNGTVYATFEKVK